MRSVRASLLAALLVAAFALAVLLFVAAPVHSTRVSEQFDADSEVESDSDSNTESDSESELEGESASASGGDEEEGESEGEAAVVIKYCAACGYHDRFLQIKTEVERRFPGAVVKGIPSSQRMDGQEFDIEVNGELISQRAVVVTNDVMVEHILGYLRKDDWDPWRNWEQDKTQYPIV